jgi:quercetin dioxygenase-like cupin family protein
LPPHIQSGRSYDEGQPPKTYKAGDSWQLPLGAVHDAKAGPAGAKVLVSYLVEKGKPWRRRRPKF